MIFQFKFPIPNYECNGIFYKEVYFEGSRCPTHHEVVAALCAMNAEEQYHAKRHPEHGPFLFEYFACLEAIDQISNNNGQLPMIAGNLVQTNVFCETDFGRKPLTVTRIQTITLE